MNQFLLIGVVAIAVLAIALEAEPRKPHLIPSRNGRVRPWKFHGFRSSMSSDNVNSQSGPVPFNCDSCKEEVTKILAADCDNLDNEPAKTSVRNSILNTRWLYRSSQLWSRNQC